MGGVENHTTKVVDEEFRAIFCSQSAAGVKIPSEEKTSEISPTFGGICIFKVFANSKEAAEWKGGSLQLSGACWVRENRIGVQRHPETSLGIKSGLLRDCTLGRRINMYQPSQGYSPIKST